MEEIKERYFDWSHIKTDDVTVDMLNNPETAKSILDNVVKYHCFLIKKEMIEHKYKHKMRELHEEYDIDFNK